MSASLQRHFSFTAWCLLVCISPRHVEGASTMKAFAFAAACCLCASAFAQSSTDRALGDSADKQAPVPAAEGAGRAASGAGPRADESFTHGESKRCENLSGDEKVLCDREEATKSQGENAKDLTSEERSPQQRQ